MAFSETRAAASPRTVLQARGICNIPITETILPGDCLGILSAEWVLSASATVDHPILIAVEGGEDGDTIEAALIAVVEVETTVANVATVGELVALNDDGSYEAAGSNLPDVGFVTSIGGDSLSAVLVVSPMLQQIDTARS